MVWPFRPRAPLPLEMKVRCERWLVLAARGCAPQSDQIPSVVTPADLEPLVDANNSEQLPQLVLDFFATRMPIPPSTLTAEWGPRKDLSCGGSSAAFQLQADGQGQQRIVVHPMFQQAPWRAAAVVATAMGGVLLSGRVPDADLAGCAETLPVLFGLGPLMANAALFDDDEQSGGGCCQKTLQVGHVGAIEMGYLMALVDQSFRLEYEQHAASLRPDAADSLKRSARFLAKTGDVCFDPQEPGRSWDNCADSVQQQLKARSNSVVLGALRELADGGAPETALCDPLATLLHHREAVIQQQAVELLSRMDSVPEQVHQEFLLLAESGPKSVRRTAILGLRPQSGDDASTMVTLLDLLATSDVGQLVCCLQTLLRFENYPDETQSRVLRAIRILVTRSDADSIRLAVTMLDRLVPDSAAVLQDVFVEDPTGLHVLGEALGWDSDMESADVSDSESTVITEQA